MICQHCSKPEIDCDCLVERKLTGAEKAARARAGKEKKAKYKPQITNVDVESLYKKLTNVLRTDTDNLLAAVRKRPLKKDEQTAVVNYIRLLKQLKEKESEDATQLTEEQLQRIVEDKE